MYTATIQIGFECKITLETQLKNDIEILLYVNIRPRVGLDLNGYVKENKEEHKARLND